ncbi:hypothetical protein [Antarcticirhabdus aurantiaca]|uniref:Uncharacterized protein n=1 Tax=Antarcticirhabdus aurantiaca TaxID=2606717 RepID=A0ACD4NLP6_9HYPH|nr:hypothetical protein OXU80_22425 [Jeongeuplla avenae]
MIRLDSPFPLDDTCLMVAPVTVGRRKLVRLRVGDITVDLNPFQAEDLGKTLATMADLAWKQ